MESEENKEEKNKLNEPGFSYNEKKYNIGFYRSFEEMNEADAKQSAERDPIENFKLVTYRLSIMYAKELSLPKNKKVIFTKVNS